jgi:hypothetical protein
VQIQLPAWLEKLPEEERDGQRTRFLLRLAALHFDPGGHLSTLSEACGYQDGTLASISRRNERVSPEMAIKLEEVLGVAIMPRELLRPDMFRKG